MATFFTGFFAAITPGAAATVATASTIGTIGAIVTASVSGVAGLLTAGSVGFFANRDAKDANSMKEVKTLTETIHETVAPRNGGAN